MDHTLLKSIIYDYHDMIQHTKILPRSYDFEPEANYVLVGMRRAGKSTMLFQRIQELIASGTQWEQIIYINFEDERLLEMSASDLDSIRQVKSELTEKKPYYFFDEIQNIEGWEQFARRLADAKEFVYVTGSNAKLLSSDISTRLGGRYLTLQIFPYSFSEYLNAKKIDHDEKARLTTRLNGRIRNAAKEYLVDGGFPESIDYRSPRVYVENIYQTVLLADIIARNRIQKTEELRLLVKKIAESVMQGIAYTSLHKELKNVGASLSVDKVIEYIGYMKESYLLFAVRRYYARFVERESTPKHYFSDNGILNLFLFNQDSALLENLVAISLHQEYEDRLYYLKSSKTGIDIDFYLPEEHTAIQVAYQLSNKNAYNREVNNLLKLAKESDQPHRLIIVSLEEEDTLHIDDHEIEVIPLYRFLLR